ncbi:DUF2231 domain-containing protein [Rhodococcus sp. NPDC056960]|jgi:uncharacterized membrane protein|uniref:DUF2231 domain-containing protein n=1 Tax=Rhodococcus sp. NPDC056960 TaxID=3345982 RepID=UPI00363BA047
MKLENLFRKAESAGFLDGGSRFLQQRIRGALGSSDAGPLLRGSWLGHPVHPVLVSLPIGAWIGATVFDLALRDHVGARRLIGLGLLATPPTLMTGWADWAERDTRQRRVGLIHAEANAVGVVAMLASYLRRRHGTDARAIATSTAGLLAIGIGGALGGHLTYAMGAGVDGVREGPEPDSLLTPVG